MNRFSFSANLAYWDWEVGNSGKMGSSSCFSRIFLASEKKSLIFFSAFLIFMFISWMRFYSACPAFLAPRDIFLPAFDSRSFCVALICISFSSSISGLMRCSGIILGLNLLTCTGTFSPSKLSFLGGFHMGLMSLTAAGWITASGE